MKKHLLSLLAIIVFVPAVLAVSVTPPAQIPAYYANVNGKSGAGLWEAVRVIACKNFSTLGYDGLWTAYAKTDLYPTDPSHPDYREDRKGKIWDMYGDCDFTFSSKQCGTYKKVCDCYNREHSIPKSWFGGGTSGIGCDIFHLVPTDGKVNGERDNDEFGIVVDEVQTEYWVGNKSGRASTWSTDRPTIASTAGEVIQGSGNVFEPLDQYKGDFARGYMGTIAKWAQANMTSGNTFFTGKYDAANNYGFTKKAVVLMMKWHREDPVSQKEIDRNNGIQQTQGNRNPFIDYPYLAEYIWGEHAGETVDMESLMASTDPEFIPGVSDGQRNTTNPVIMSPRGTILFGETNTTMSLAQDIVIQGKNLEEGELTLTLESDVEYFSLETYTVTSEQAAEGYVVTATYAPTAEGQHSARLIINGCGITDHIVLLTGSCVASHTITWESVDGTQYTTARTGALPVLPSDIPTTCPDNEDRVFVGWTTDATYSDETTAPSDMFLEPVETIVEPVTYYAVYADKEVNGNSSTVTFTAGVDKGSNNTITKDGVTCALSRTTTNDYYQIFGSASGTISSEEFPITQIVFTCTGSGNSSYGPGKIKINVGNYSYDGYVGTWTGEAMSVTAQCSSQVRMTSIVVTVGSGTTTFSNFSLLCPEDDPSDIEEMHLTTPVAQKVLVNGQLLILRDGKIFTVQGVQIR